MKKLLNVVILAAGRGSRLNADVPKPLVKLHSKPLILYILESVSKAFVDIEHKISIIVSAETISTFEALLKEYSNIDFVIQKTINGTGGAFKTFLAETKIDSGTILVLNGDMPLIQPNSLQSIYKTHENNNCSVSLATILLDSFEGRNETFMNFGRIIRSNDNKFEKITEASNLSEEEKKELFEVNPGIYVFDKVWASEYQDLVTENPIQQEIFITDFFKVATSQNSKVGIYNGVDLKEAFGINTPEDFARVNQLLTEISN